MPRASGALVRAPRQGPIDFLPSADLLVRNMERQWGEVDRYRGIATSAAGALWGTRCERAVDALSWFLNHQGRSPRKDILLRQACARGTDCRCMARA
jgi:hypothetical protein